MTAEIIGNPELLVCDNKPSSQFLFSFDSQNRIDSEMTIGNLTVI